MAEQSEPPTEKPALDPTLDVSSAEFNPLRALYATDYKVTKKKPKVLYQNLASLESAVNRFGVWNLNKRNEKQPNKEQDETKAGTSSNTTATTSITESTKLPRLRQDGEELLQRRFEPHQMAVRRAPGDGSKRHQRSLMTQMALMEGPLALLWKCVQEEGRIRVLMRREHGVRGSIVGQLLCFDKHWNLLLRDVSEVWQRRKYKYGENKISNDGAVARNCAKQLSRLGITLPVEQVKSLNRKNVEISRQLSQLCVRGEQVVLVVLLQKESQ